jgi:hypothetical protein
MLALRCGGERRFLKGSPGLQTSCRPALASKVFKPVWRSGEASAPKGLEHNKVVVLGVGMGT